MKTNVWSWTWCFFLLCGVSSLNFTTRQQFNDKFFSAKELLTNNFYQKSRDINDIKMDSSILWSQPIDMQQNFNNVPSIVRTFNHTLVISNSKLWVLKNEQLISVTNFESNFSSEVQLVKGVEWQDRLLLLLCSKESCSLYSENANFDFSFCQPISDEGIPVDVQFFIQRGTLFLGVLFQKFYSTVSHLRIYQWRNLYMDPERIPEIFSTSSSLTVFDYRDDTIFVLGCSRVDELKFPTQVWSRKQNGEMNKVQYLPTVSPVTVTHFQERDENFILITEKSLNASVYWWKGSEFVQWMSVDGLSKYSKVSASSNLKYTPLLIFTHRNIVRVCFMTSTKLNKIYEREFSSEDTLEPVLVLSATMWDEQSGTYMLMLIKSQQQIIVTLLKVFVQQLYTTAEFSKEVLHTDSAQESLNVVYDGVKSLKNRMDVLNTLTSSILLTNKDMNISQSIARVSQEVSLDHGVIQKVMYLRMDIAGWIRYLIKRISPIKEQINMYKEKLQTTSVYQNRYLVFEGNVHLKEAKMNSATVHKLTVNNIPFEPDSYLTLTSSEKQSLESVKAKTLKVNWLGVHDIGNKKVKDLLVTNGTVRVPVSMAGLVSRNLKMDDDLTINNITVRDLTHKMVTVKPEEGSFNTISQIGAGKNLGGPKILKLQDHTVIEKLNVDLIHDVPVSEILHSVFVNTIRNVIYGNIHFKGGLRTYQIAARKYSLPDETDAQYSPQMGDYPLIPLHPSSVLKFPQNNRYLQFAPSRKQFFPDEGRMKRDNTKNADKKQIRKTKVKITGNLQVKKLLFKNSSLVLNGTSVPSEGLEKLFWTHSTPQTINGSVLFSQGVSIATSLESPMVNGKNLSHYATRNSNFGSIIFEDIYVDGDITARDPKNTEVHMLENVQQAYTFTVVNVNHLQVESINGENFENMLRASDLLKGGVRIYIDTLRVNGDLKADLINNITLTKYLTTAVMIDQDLKLKEVEFKRISGDNVEVENLNNHPIDVMLDYMKKEIPVVSIHGDIHMPELSSVTSINNFPANFSKVVNKKKGATIFGRKKFEAQVSISKNIKITNINKMNVENLFKNLLRLSTDQNITGIYTMKTAQMKSLTNVSEINGVSTSKFVYIRNPQVNIANNLTFKTIEIEGDLTSKSFDSSCQLPKVEDELVFEQASEWSTVKISGNSEWLRTSNGRLQRIFDSAVTSNGNQTITGDVIIKHLSVRKMQVQLLNDKNITFILQDYFSKKKENQVIKGKKQFIGHFNCQNIEVKGDARVKSINNENINAIDEKLVRHTGNDSQTIYGHKSFLIGFGTFHFYCAGGINGVKSKDIVGPKFNGIAPPTIIQSLKVLGPILVETIDGLHIESFLKDCIYLDSAGPQTIKGDVQILGNIYLKGEATVSNINNISTSDLVFVNNEKSLAKIKGCKQLLTNLQIETDPHIGILNGRKLKETYINNVKVDQNVTINGTLTILSEVELNTVYAHEYFVRGKKLTFLKDGLLVNRTVSP